MIDAIPANTDALETWLVSSGGYIAISNEGLSLLEPELSLGSDGEARQREGGDGVPGRGPGHSRECRR